MPIKDRLAAGNTLQQYETAYRKAFIATVKASNPKWELGKPFSQSLLDNVSREDIEKSLQKGGKTLVQHDIDLQI